MHDLQNTQVNAHSFLLPGSHVRGAYKDFVWTTSEDVKGSMKMPLKICQYVSISWVVELSVFLKKKEEKMAQGTLKGLKD